ncbi:MAG: alpha-E domain-containing protein [Frankiaceae bacterium]
MLSRVAEALFWVGRYVERAEDTARLLDVLFHQILEDPAMDEQQGCQIVASVMGVDASKAIDTGWLLDQLGYDEKNPSSIVGALQAARQNARTVREALSAEIWESLNTAYHELPSRVDAARGFGPAPFFSYIRQRAALIAGLAESSMIRDDAYDFVVLGRNLERVDMTARLLSARISAPSPYAEWVTTLRACSAQEAYQRTYHRSVEARTVIEFLVLDRLFPRSVFHALVVAEEALARLDPAEGRIGYGDEARLILGRARTDLEFLPPEGLFDRLPERLQALQHMVSEVSEAVGHRLFAEPEALDWNLEESR